MDQQELSYEFMNELLEYEEESEFIANFKKFKAENCEKTNFDSEITKMVSNAVKIGSDEIIRLMISNEIDVSRKSPAFAFSPMAIAANRGYFKILKLLVDAKKGIEPGISHKILHASFQDRKTDKVDYEKCFKTIAPYINVHKVDDIKNTPLHYAVNHRNHAASLGLMKRNAFIGAKNMFNESPLDEMNFKVLKEALDDRVTLIEEKDAKGKRENKICVDFNLFLNEEKEFEVETLEIIAENPNLRPLITHGVISTLIYLKLKEFKLILYTNFFIFGTLLASLIVYIVMCHTELKEYITIFKFISYFGIFLLIIREFTQLILCLNSKMNYFKSAMNIFEIFFIILAISSLLFDSIRDLHIFTIICATIEILHLMNELPNFWISCHMQILKKVAITFLKSLALYSIILISFAMSFFILFSKNETQNLTDNESDNFTNFAYPGIAVIKTFVMLTGEFDAASLSLHDKDASYCLMFLLFIFIVTIVLFNLLSALAFDDTTKIKAESELYVLCGYIKILRKYERILMKFKRVKNFINFNLYDDKIIIQPSKGYLVTSMSDNEGSSNDTTLEIEENVSKTGCINCKFIKINYCNRLDKEIGQKLKDIVEFNEEKKINEENENFLKAKIEAISGELHQLKQKMTEQNDDLNAKIEKSMVIMID